MLTLTNPKPYFLQALVSGADLGLSIYMNSHLNSVYGGPITENINPQSIYSVKYLDGDMFWCALFFAAQGYSILVGVILIILQVSHASVIIITSINLVFPLYLNLQLTLSHSDQLIINLNILEMKYWGVCVYYFFLLFLFSFRFSYPFLAGRICFPWLTQCNKKSRLWHSHCLSCGPCALCVAYLKVDLCHCHELQSQHRISRFYYSISVLWIGMGRSVFVAGHVGVGASAACNSQQESVDHIW